MPSLPILRSGRLSALTVMSLAMNPADLSWSVNCYRSRDPAIGTDSGAYAQNSDETSRHFPMDRVFRCKLRSHGHYNIYFWQKIETGNIRERDGQLQIIRRWSIQFGWNDDWKSALGAKDSARTDVPSIEINWSARLHEIVFEFGTFAFNSSTANLKKVLTSIPMPMTHLFNPSNCIQKANGSICQFYTVLKGIIAGPPWILFLKWYICRTKCNMTDRPAFCLGISTLPTMKNSPTFTVQHHHLIIRSWTRRHCSAKIDASDWDADCSIHRQSSLTARPTMTMTMSRLACEHFRR